MKDEKRMTLDQFVRNNRGINGGADLPIEFLTNLYYEIKVRLSESRLVMCILC
jgi:brefeldin A-resistance guanine nucleotide exchange factor 1